MMNKPTVGLYTLGCKVSQYETEAISEAFEAAHFSVCDFASAADVYVINTCTVTAESDRKCRQVIRRAARQNPDAKILVCGCYSQRTPNDLQKIPSVSAVIGSYGKMALPSIAVRLLEGKPPFENAEGIINVSDVEKEPFEEMKITKCPRTRVYVKIEDGCQCKCTYCAISSARGAVRSKPVDKVIEEVESLSASGVAEVVLTGIETGSYGADLDKGTTLVSLLRELDRRRSAKRIRLGSLAPELVGEAFARGIADLKSLAPHFHISVQSGSDAVLRRMKRRYSAKTALENIKRIKKLIPDAQFTTDLMVGFPGESDDDFLATCEFLNRARFLDCHVFAYSRRKDTPAADYEDQIPEQIKRERSDKLIALAKEVSESVLLEIVEEGKPLSSVLETKKGELWLGHADNFAEVALVGRGECDLHGKVLPLKPVSLKNGVIYCTLDGDKLV